MCVILMKLTWLQKLAATITEDSSFIHNIGWCRVRAIQSLLNQLPQSSLVALRRRLWHSAYSMGMTIHSAHCYRSKDWKVKSSKHSHSNNVLWRVTVIVQYVETKEGRGPSALNPYASFILQAGIVMYLVSFLIVTAGLEKLCRPVSSL